MLTKCMEKRLDRNCTRIVQAILNISWKQHPTKQLVYAHLPLISKIMQIRWTRHVRHCRRSKNELISNFLLRTPSHGCVSVGQPTRTYRQHLCMDTGHSLEELPEAMNDRDDDEREPEKSVLIAWHNDDFNIYIYIQKVFLNMTYKECLLKGTYIMGV